MKKYLKRVLAMMLAVVTVLGATNLVQAGVSGPSGGSSTGAGSVGSGISGGGYIIGFGKCTEETYTGGATEDELWTWVNRYATEHYVQIQGDCFAVPTKGYAYDNVPVSSVGSRKILSTSGDPAGILNDMVNKSLSSNPYLEASGDGFFAIKPECIDEVVEMLRECNEALYMEWMSNRYGMDGHPVVLVIEAFACDSGDSVGYTTYDLAQQAGAASALLNPNPSDTVMTLGVSGGLDQASATAKVIVDSGHPSFKDTHSVGYNLFGYLFGISSKTGNARSSKAWVQNLAAAAQGGVNTSTITGCYPISIGGFGITSGSPPGKGNFLFGQYTWDFNAPELSPNDRGFAEDSSVEISKGHTVSGSFDFGYVNPKSASWGTWQAWKEAYGGSTVDIELNVYSVAQTNGQDNYTTQADTIMSAGNSNKGGAGVALADKLTCTGVSFDTFVTWLKNGLPQGIQWQSGMSGSHQEFPVSWSTEGGAAGVAYFTTMNVKPYGDGRASQDGKWVPFACNTVHWAWYTPLDDDRTYKYATTLSQGYSQIKDDARAAAAFEAMTGTPTTEDMFISMGGNEFLVNMQYTLHVEDYVREYAVEVPEHDNYMYYNAGQPTNRHGETPLYKNKPGDVTINNPPSQYGGATGTNKAWELNKGSAESNQRAVFKEQATAFHDSIEKLFKEIDENATAGSDPYAMGTDKYDIVVPKGALSLAGDWSIKGIDQIKGKRSSLVTETKKQLEDLSKDLQALKKYIDGNGYRDRHYFSNFAAAHSKLYSGYTISFFQLTEGMDYDSDADGAVTVKIKFSPTDAVDWRDSPKSYAHKNDKYLVYDGHSGHGRHEYDCGVRCDEAGSHIFDNSSACGECTSKPCNAPDHKHSPCSGRVGGSDDTDHTHYGHVVTNSNSYRKQYGGVDWQPIGSNHSITRQPKEEWKAEVSWEVTPNYMGAIKGRGSKGEQKEIANDTWGDRGKRLGYSGTIKQVYKDVKYIDIVEAHVWRLAGGVADVEFAGAGGDCLVPETRSQYTRPIIEMACNSLGFTLYNTQAVDQKSYFVKNYTNSEGNSYKNVWVAVDEHFAEQIQLDTSIDDEAEWSANSELSTIGRLANSYNPGSSEIAQFFADGKEGREDVMKISGGGDSLLFKYDILKQGGRSHWSFDGFLKQALANTFYAEVSADNAGTAYRNYIIVQSDFLSMGDTTHSMVGGHWMSKPMDKGAGTTSDKADQEYGLTQAILCSDKDLEGSDLSRYACESGAGWEIAGSLDETNVNDRTAAKQHADTKLIDIKQGDPRSEVGKGSTPSDHTLPFNKYREKPEEYDVQEFRDASEEMSFVRLDQNPSYKSFTVATMTGGGGTTNELGMWENFGGHGKGGASNELSANISNFNFKVGYDNQHDSVEVDKHIPAPIPTGSSPYDTSITAISGFEADFAMYAGTPKEILTDDGGAVPAGGPVSASNNPKNRIVQQELWYPYYTGLNVTRWLQNGKYKMAETALVYSECLALAELPVGTQSIMDKTTGADSYKRSGKFSQYYRNISDDLYTAGSFDNMVNGTLGAVTSSTNTIIHKVGYGGSGSEVNEVVIFNPSAAEHTFIVPVSELVPDGQNKYLDDGSGYTERDQRVSETLVTSDGNETYISYEPITVDDLKLESLKYKWSLTEKTTYNGGITEAYTMDDYITTDKEIPTWTLKPGSEPFTATTTGSYRFTVFDNLGKSTSVELRLVSGDRVTTDGTSVFLDRAEDSAPLVTYDRLANSVARFYMNIDSLTQGAEATMSGMLISGFLESGESQYEYLKSALESVRNGWNAGTASTLSQADYDNIVSTCNTEIAKFNSFISSTKCNLGDITEYSISQGIPTKEYRMVETLREEYALLYDKVLNLGQAYNLSTAGITAVTPIKRRTVSQTSYWYNYSPSSTTEKDHVKLGVNGSDGYVKLSVIPVDKYITYNTTTKVVASISDTGTPTEATTGAAIVKKVTNRTVIATDAAGVMTIKSEDGTTDVRYFDYDQYVIVASRSSSDLSGKVTTFVDDATRQTALQNAYLKLEEKTPQLDSTAAQAEKLKSLVTEFNNFIVGINNTFNTKTNGDLVLKYDTNMDLLDEFLVRLGSLKDTYNSFINLNSLDFSVGELPKLVLEPSEGKASTFKEDGRFKVDKGALMTVDFTGLRISPGGVLKVTIPYDKDYNNPATVTLQTDGNELDFNSVHNGTQNQDGYSHTMYTYRDSNNAWVYVIEAFEDIQLGQMRFSFNQDAYIQEFSGSCVGFDKIWLADVGTSETDKYYLGTTIEHQYYDAGSIHWANATRKRSINKILFDATGLDATITVNKESATLYISKESEVSSILNPVSANNPHKVYNANWRYYVLGWTTKSGSKILRADDPRLFIDSTVLNWPFSGSGTVTVKELRESACLVKYNGKVYLTLREAALDHRILQTGTKVKQYDWFSLNGSATQELTLDKYDYPLEPNLVAMDLNGNHSHWEGKYEFLFRLLDDDMYKPLFNVEYSTNLEYRFSKTDKEILDGTVTNWEHDWIREEEKFEYNTNVVPGRDSGNTDYISLDDEFEIYFDNVGSFPGDGTKNTGSTSQNLGYGWDAAGTKLLGPKVKLDIPKWFGVSDDTDDAGETEVIVGGTTQTIPATECTGWIYAKYVIFNFDVYVFMDSSGKINPGLGAYNEDGSRNEAVLVKAGDPVYLGEYLSGSGDFNNPTDAFQNDWCNYGGFYDYGAPAVTDDAFVYHFWCPLYNGEMKDSARVEFHTININDAKAVGNPAGNLNKVKEVEGVKVLDTSDTIGASGYSGPKDNNDTHIYNRPHHADDEDNTSIVGRIGALTIADTGDPRYSDSFKTTDIDNNDTDAFLLYPIVRKILGYSNIDTRDGATVFGTQRGVVLDPFDVRGRICTEWMKDYVRTHNNSKDWSAYKTYACASYDTYGSQWFKHSLIRFTRGMEDSNTKQFAQALPLTPDFNKHETFKAKPLRVGYEVYCSVESIGNYFGESDLEGSGAFEDDEDGSVSNLNNDYGQNKVQVRPFYASVGATNGAGDVVPDGPVDVYMRSGDTYVLINSGADGHDSEHPISEILQVIYNNYHPSYIETNSGDTELDLDENMKRRLVTVDESRITYETLRKYTWRKSMLTKVTESTSGIGGEDLDIRYTYGCSQMLFLRERNLTYVGGKTAPLCWKNPVLSEDDAQNKVMAQKWYFGLGLPSSAVFVPHGQELTDKTVLKTGIVVNSIDVVAKGKVWTIHYEAEVSKMSFEYEGGTVDWETWNPWHEKFPWLVPVTYYNIGDTSTADLDTQGSH